MRFDYTKGQEARYMTSVYGVNVEDHYYYHIYKEAKAAFDRLKGLEHEPGTSISVYDLKNDVKKEFARV